MNVRKPSAVIAVITAALGAVLVASSAQATLLGTDTNTKGLWRTGGPGDTQVYGTRGYILNAWNQPSGWANQTAPDPSHDLSSLPSYVTSYSYTADEAGVSARYYEQVANSVMLQNPSPGDPALSNGAMIYGGVHSIRLELMPGALPFELSVYNFDWFSGASPDNTYLLTVACGPNSDSVQIDHDQQTANHGIWASFEVVPNGATELTITTTPNGGSSASEIAGIMFDGGSVPEPSTLVLLGMGGFVLWLRRRQR